MAFTENLKVEIESIFDGEGFQRLRNSLRKTRTQTKKTKAELQSLGQQSTVAALGGSGGPFSRGKTDLRKMGAGDLNMGSSRGGQGFFTGMPAFNPSQARNIRETQSNMQRLRGTLQGLNVDIGSLNPLVGANQTEFDGLGSTTTSTGNSVRTFKTKLNSASGAISGMIPDVQSLQMRLLGLQFQLLSLAFIFGGLMMSAMGAVGIFKILGNTLKMFFLPTALELLPLMLDIRDAVLGVGDGTKKQVGKIFLIISAFSLLGSLLAFTLNGFLAVASAIWSLSAPFRFILRSALQASSYFGNFGRLLGYVKAGLTGLVNIFGSIGMAVAGVAAFLATLVGGFLIVTRTAKKFGKKVAAVMAAILVVIGGVIATIASAPIIIAAGIGLAIGAILGFLWTFRDTIINVITGVGSFIMGFFSWLFGGIAGIFNWIINAVVNTIGGIIDVFVSLADKLVGNSIIPDMIKDIIDWFFKLPKKIVGIGASIVDTIIQGIKNTGKAIWNAFKKILPDFLVDAIEGAGGAVKGIVDSAGNILGSAGSTIGEVGKGIFEGVKGFGSDVIQGAQDFVSGGSDKANNASPKPGSGEEGGNKTQNNTFNVQAEVNDKEETPQETGRELGKGLSQTMNNRQSSEFSSGT